MKGPEIVFTPYAPPHRRGAVAVSYTNRAVARPMMKFVFNDLPISFISLNRKEVEKAALKKVKEKLCASCTLSKEGSCTGFKKAVAEGRPPIQGVIAGAVVTLAKTVPDEDTDPRRNMPEGMQQKMTEAQQHMRCLQTHTIPLDT